jgi:hypothetical protein
LSSRKYDHAVCGHRAKGVENLGMMVRDLIWGINMIAIRNFGMYWVRDKVEWGRPRTMGQLRGVRATKRRDSPVDFRTQTGIYVLYDEQRAPLWIGQAQLLYKRLSDHRRDHLRDRWKYFTWFGFRRINDNGTLGLSSRLEFHVKGQASEARDEIEAVLIQVLEPRLNRRGSNWHDTEEFLQYDSGNDEDEE